MLKKQAISTTNDILKGYPTICTSDSDPAVLFLCILKYILLLSFFKKVPSISSISTGSRGNRGTGIQKKKKTGVDFFG